MKRGQPNSSVAAGSQGQVRIIAGRFRGRKLPVPEVEGLRPTGDRVRETLFNWLQGDIAGARCLDLFAGSGALGFEALSRYAQNVTFVEPDAFAQRNLGDICRLLDIAESEAHLQPVKAQVAIDQWTVSPVVPTFNVVFIDPPFLMDCQWSILDSLVPHLMEHNARIYIESPVSQSIPEILPDGCELIREKRFGDVVARLLRYCNPGVGL